MCSWLLLLILSVPRLSHGTKYLRVKQEEEELNLRALGPGTVDGYSPGRVRVILHDLQRSHSSWFIRS